MGMDGVLTGLECGCVVASWCVGVGFECGVCLFYGVVVWGLSFKGDGLGFELYLGIGKTHN